MAVLAFSLAGAALAPAGYASFGWTIGGLLGNAIMGQPDVEVAPAFGPRLTDLKVQTSVYGNMVPRGYGTARMAGNIIWAPDITEHATTTTVTTGGGGKGGGGGGSTQEQTTYSYSADCAIAICEGPIIGIRKVWANGKLIYDVGDESDIFSVLASSIGMTIYTGSETQTADPLMVAALGAANVPGYRGTSYVVFDDFYLTDYGNRIPNFEFETVISGSLEVLVPHAVYDLESGEDFDGSSLSIDNLVQLSSGSFNTWVVEKISGNYRNIVMYDNYSGERMLQYDPGATETQLIGVGPERVWFENRPNGFGYLTNSGELVRYDQFITSDALRIVSLYEPPSLLIDQVVFIEFNSATPSTVLLYKILIDETPDEDDVIQRLITVPFTTSRAIRAWIQRANRISGRMYLSAFFVDNALLAYVTTGRDDSVAATVIRTYNTANTLYAFVGHDGYIYARSVNTGFGNLIEKLDQGGTVIDSCTLPGISSATLSGDTRFSQDASEFLYVSVNTGGSKKIYRIRYATMDVDASEVFTTSSEQIMPSDAFEDKAIVSIRAASAPNPTLRMIARDRVVTDPPLLSDIVTDLCELSGLDSSDLDVSQLTTRTCRGYVISRRDSARSMIEPLMMSFFFDAVESDNKIKFVTRGGAQAVVIPEDDLAAHSGAPEESPDQLSIVRKQEMELPVEVNVKYFNPAIDYQIAQQRSRRLITSAKQSINMDLAIVLTDDEAQQIADAAMFTAWANRQSHEFTTSRKYFKYEPTDLVGVVKNDVTHNLRIVSKEEHADGVIAWKAVTEEVSCYTQTGVGIGVDVEPAEVKMIGPTNAVFMDIPLLRDDDDDAGFYVAQYGVADGWHGAHLFQSRDDGDTYSAMTNGLTLVQSTVGRAIGVLGELADNHRNEHLDTKNYVDIVMMHGEISSITYAQLMDYGNAAMLGAELIQFMTAELIDTNTYRISGLLRGRLGTETDIAGHALGDKFVLLDGNIRSINTPISQVNTESLYKPASVGRTLQQTVAVAFTNSARKKRPLSIVHLAATQDISGNWNIVFDRRTRYRAAWADGVDAPLGETEELFEIEFLSGDEAVVNTYQTDTTSYQYTVAQQTADFGSAVNGIVMDVYPVSPQYGRGEPTRYGIPGAHQYWRFRNVNNGHAFLELTEVRLFSDGVDITDLATFSTNPVAPSFGTLAVLHDNDPTTRAQYSTGQVPSFWDPTWYMQFFFAAGGVKINGFKQGTFDDFTLRMTQVTIEYSDNGTNWFEQAALTGLAAPAAHFTLSALYEF